MHSGVAKRKHSGRSTYLYDHSHQQEVSGGTAVTMARVINGAVLVATKLHSGRETDLWDVLAVA